MGKGEQTRPSLPLIVMTAVAAVFVFALSLGHLRNAKEPAYQGKPLSYWLNSPQEGMKVNEAVLAIGPANMPFVRADLRARDSQVTLWFRRLMQKQSVINYHYVPAHSRHERAIRACYILGTNAVVALPELEALLNEPKPNSQLAAAIGRTGLSGTLVLIRAMTHTNREVQSEATGAIQISYLGPNALDASPAINFLTNQLRHPLPEKRAEAANVLGLIHQNPQARLTALAQCVDDLDHRVRRSAVSSLGRIGRNSNAEPVIRRAFLDADPSVRIAATNALKRLYPPPRIDYE
jgi:hypothetical protein